MTRAEKLRAAAMLPDLPEERIGEIMRELWRARNDWTNPFAYEPLPTLAQLNIAAAKERHVRQGR